MRAYTGPTAVHVDEAAARAAGEARAAYWHLWNTTEGYLVAEQEYQAAVEEAAARAALWHLWKFGGDREARDNFLSRQTKILTDVA
jgi:hypothetical protein